MLSPDVIFSGFADAFTLVNMGYVVLGVFLGQLSGAVPLVGPAMGMAVMVPFTFVLSPVTAMGFLIGVSKGGLVGGAIPAVLLSTPGASHSVATALDGHLLTQQGKPIKALKTGLYASVTGDVFSDLVLIASAFPLALLAFQMGPVEMCAVMGLSFTVLIGLMSGTVAKGALSLLLGMLFATVGLDPDASTERLTFGQDELYNGVALVCMAVGIMAMPVILVRLAGEKSNTMPLLSALLNHRQPDDDTVTWQDYWRCRFAMARGAMVGTIFGAIPGIGSTSASTYGYALQKAHQKPDETPYGQGNIKGIAVAESANSAVTGANLIPVLALGIPGNIGAALLMTALLMHGITPGPTLLADWGHLIFALFAMMLVANGVNLAMGYAGMGLWVRVMQIPPSLVFAVAIVLCIVGTYLATGTVFGVMLMFALSIVGVYMLCHGYSTLICLVGFFLYPQFETKLVQSIGVLNGNPYNLINHPIALFFVGLTLVFIIYFDKKRRWIHGV